MAPLHNEGQTLSEMVNQWGVHFEQVESASATGTINDETKYISLSAEEDGTKVVDNKRPCSGDGCAITGQNIKYWLMDFGATVNGDVAGGDFNGNVTVSALVMPNFLPEFYTITYMHEMTPEVCDSVPTPEAVLQNSITRLAAVVLSGWTTPCKWRRVDY